METNLNQIIQSKLQSLVQLAIETLGEDTIICKKYPKNTIILNKGEISQFVYFIKSGSTRNFIYNKNGNEITTWFAFENHVTLAPASYFIQVPTFEMIETMEVSEIYSFPFDILMSKIKSDIVINKTFRGLLEIHVTLMSNRMHSLQGKFAEERYKDLVIDFPHIIQRVPLSYIASYLGISIETLSRIRHSKKK